MPRKLTQEETVVSLLKRNVNARAMIYRLRLKVAELEREVSTLKDQVSCLRLEGMNDPQV